MKKLIGLFLAALAFLIPAPSFAGESYRQVIASTTLDADPTSVTGATQTGAARRSTFFVHYDETDAGAALSVAVTLHVSDDNSTWIAGNFYDIAGTSTLQTSETISSDGDYVFWLNPDLAAPYTRVTLTATGSDATHTAVVTCTALLDQ